MAFSAGDIRSDNKAYNLLERSQNSSNNATRASWDRMFLNHECKDCDKFSEILGQCHPTTKSACEDEANDPYGCFELKEENPCPLT